MSRKIILPMLFSIAIFGTIGTMSLSFAQSDVPQDKICENETIESGVFKSITVTSNSYCNIKNAEIIKDVRAENAQFVTIQSSTIGGNIILDSVEYGIDIFASAISKNVKISGDIADIQIHNSEIGKNLKIIDTEALVTLDFVNSKVSENFVLKNNNFYFDGHDSNETYIVGNEIMGGVQIRDNVNFVDLLFGGNSIGKNLVVSGNAGDVTYGDLNVSVNQIHTGKLVIKENSGNIIEAGRNTVNKNFMVSKNNANSLSVNDSIVAKNLVISEHPSLDFFSIESNDAKKIKVKNNHIDVRFQCDGNFPEPIMKKNTFAGVDFNECKLIVNS